MAMNGANGRFLREIFLATIIPLIIGTGGAYVGVKVAMAEIQASLKYTQQELTRLRGHFEAHKSTDGHAAMIERVDGVKRQIERLEDYHRTQ